MSSLRAYLSTSIPEEMDSYLEGLIRGVLKHQPPDINLFAMQYFQSLVDMRKQKGEDKPMHEHVDSYPMIISIKNLKTDSRHSSKHETREKREAKESSLGEDTSLTSSEMNSLTRDLSLQDKSLNSLTFNQSTAPASLEKSDALSLPIGALKGDFSSLEQPVTSCSENISDVKLDNLSEIHTELQSNSASNVPKSHSNEEKTISEENSTLFVPSEREINFEIQDSVEKDEDMKTYTIQEVTSEEVSDLFVDEHSLVATANMESEENFQKYINKQNTDGPRNALDVSGKTLVVDIESSLNPIDNNENKNVFPEDLQENIAKLDQFEILDEDGNEKGNKQIMPKISALVERTETSKKYLNKEELSNHTQELVIPSTENIHQANENLKQGSRVGFDSKDSVQDSKSDTKIKSSSATVVAENLSEITQVTNVTPDKSDALEINEKETVLEISKTANENVNRTNENSLEMESMNEENVSKLMRKKSLETIVNEPHEENMTTILVNAESMPFTQDVSKNAEPIQSTEYFSQIEEAIQSTEDVTQNTEALQSTENVSQNAVTIHSKENVPQNSEIIQSTEDVIQKTEPLQSTEDVTKKGEAIQSKKDMTQNAETIQSTEDVTQNTELLQSIEDVTQNAETIQSTEDVIQKIEPIQSTEDMIETAETIQSTEDVAQNVEPLKFTESTSQNAEAIQTTEDVTPNNEAMQFTEDLPQNVEAIYCTKNVSFLGGQVNENAPENNELLQKPSFTLDVNTNNKFTDSKIFEEESTTSDKNIVSDPGLIEQECTNLPKITVDLDFEITDDPVKDLDDEESIDETKLDPQYQNLELPNEDSARFKKSPKFVEIFEVNDDVVLEENMMGSRNIDIPIPSQEGTRNFIKFSSNEISHLESIIEDTEIENGDEDNVRALLSDSKKIQPDIFDKEIDIFDKEMDVEPQSKVICAVKLSHSAVMPDVGGDVIYLDDSINNDNSKIISSEEKLENLKETKENSSEILLWRSNNIDSKKSKLIGEKEKSIDFDEVITQINPCDLQVEEIEEFTIFHEIMSSAVKVDSLNMDSSQSESNGSLIPDKVEQTKGIINISNDGIEKVVDSLANMKTIVGLPLIQKAPIMISKVIEIKELDEISDDDSLQHVQPSEVTGTDDDNSSSFGGTESSTFPQTEFAFKSIIITEVVEPRIFEESKGEKLEDEAVKPNEDKESTIVCDASVSSNEEIPDESHLEKHEELDECDEDKAEFSAKINSIVDQSLLEELEIFDILTSAADFSSENAAQSSLSPSSTHDSERKPLDDGSPIHEITRQPISSIREESEDHADGEHDKIELRENNNNNTDTEDRKSSLRCIGVEATAVRQLAASTGTVAILGTTAKVGLKKSASGNLIEDDISENADIVEVVIEHNNIIQSNSGTVPQTIEAIAKEVRTDLIKNGFQKPVIHGEIAGDSLVTNESTLNNNIISLDENFNSTVNQETENILQKEIDSNVHITSELTNKVSEDISISKENNISNVNIAPSNLDNQNLKTKEIVTNNLESTIPESNIDNYDSTVKAPSLEQKPSSAVIKNDNMDQSSTNINIETRTNNTTLDKQSKVPLAKHFKQEVNTSEVITKPKSKSSKESSVDKDITISGFDRNRSVDSNKSDLTNISKTSSLEQYSDNVDAIQSQIKNNTELTKLPNIDSKSVLSSTVSDAVEDIIASATSIVLERTKTKIAEKSHTEIETLDSTDIESKKSMSNDLDSDSNEPSDKTVISQESLNEENVRDGVTSVSISKIPTNKNIDEENSSEKVNDVLSNGELNDEVKKELLTDINGIIKQAEEHVNSFKEELEKIVENGVPDEDSVSLRSKNSFDVDETSVKELNENEKENVSVKESNEKKSTSEDKVLPIILETLPKKIKKELSLSLTSQTDESSIEISPENDVSNTVSETSEATKDVFTPRSGNCERTPQYDGTPLSEERTPRIDFPLSDSMMDDLKKQIDGICDEAVARIATATTKIQAGFRGYKTRKSLKHTNNEDEAQGSLDGEDYLPPPDLERLGSIHEDDALRPPDEVPDFDTDPDFPAPPPSDSASESLSSAATKIQAGVRGYLTRKQVKQGSSTTVPTDSDFSETSVNSQDLMKTSMDLETQVQRVDDTGRNFRGGKRMSLDSNIREVRPYRPPLRSVVSERDDGDDDDPQEIWRILTQEADKAAVLIQSSFRGYQARKKLSRGDAVHMPTTSSSATPSSARSEDPAPNPHPFRGTGEFHDAVFGTHDPSTNPTIMVSATRNTITDENEAAAKIQAGFRGYKVRRDLKDNSKSDQTCSTSSSSEPLSVEDKSAAKIQAGVRGYLVRKRKNEEKKAATKIQAGFRGYKTRKELKSPGSDESRSLC